MNDLSDKMRERLEKWKQNPSLEKSLSKFNSAPISKRNGKNDYGDAMTLEEWNEEVKRSQKRK